MKNKVFFASCIAIFAIVLAISTVLASDDFVSLDDVKVNDISVLDVSHAIAGEVTQKVPVEVMFTANEDVDDVRVKVYIEGYRTEVSDETPRFRVVNGSTYLKRFTLELPSTEDMDVDPEGLSVTVRVSAKGKDSIEVNIPVELQRDLYSLSILSIDAPDTVTAGSTIALDVVVENNGHLRQDNTYVKASIPELGIERKVYAGDLESDHQESYDNIRNTVEKRIYITIPSDAKAGNYNLEVQAYGYDVTTTAKQRIVVQAMGSSLLPTTSSKTVSVGQTTQFDLVLVNPNNKMVVYSLTPQESDGLLITIDQPVVAVPADSSQTVKVSVKATDSAQQGTHVVTVNANSDSGVSKQISFTANVEKTSSNQGNTPVITKNNTVLILTVVLSIIFIVLLIVLIVLLTRKPAEEEFGETSYY